MRMPSLLLCCAFAAAAVPAVAVGPAVAGEGPAKQVLYTSWWPPGTEKTAEAVGILSRGDVFMTGMMEENETLTAQIAQELLDVADIAAGGGTGMNSTLACLVNTKYPGTADAVRAVVGAQLQAFGGGAALTVIEAAGEFPFFNTSTTCRSFVPAAAADGKVVVSGGPAAPNDVAVSAGGEVHASVESAGGPDAAVAQLQSLLHRAANATGAAAAAVVVDCLVAVGDVATDAAGVRQAFSNHFPTTQQPTTTIIGAGLATGASVAMQCVASHSNVTTSIPPTLGGGDGRIRGRNGMPAPRTVTAGKFVYVDGLASRLKNGTDALAQLGDLLQAAGTSLDEVLMCHTFAAETKFVQSFFKGFYQVFNVEHYPPPARVELTAASECTQCPVLVKCVAALPHTAH